MSSSEIIEALEDLATEGFSNLQISVESKDFRHNVVLSVMKDGKSKCIAVDNDGQLADGLHGLALPETWGGSESQWEFVDRKRKEREERKLRV